MSNHCARAGKQDVAGAMVSTQVSDSTPAPSQDAKPSQRQYGPWLVEKELVSDLDVSRNHYDTVTEAVKNQYLQCSFWQAILRGLKDVDAQYLIDHKYPLIAQYSPEIVIKPWFSFLEKTYRKNILNNANFPNPPNGGWISPTNWHSTIHDVIRTTIIVKYLDGVPLLVEFLRGASQEHEIEFQGGLEARVDGYYGAQCICSAMCDLTGLDWIKEQKRVSLEIQVTTTMKDVIKRLLHSYYEIRRVEFGQPSQIELSWNYKSDEFIATYLGHILHYVEGMILDVRDRKRG
jgi:ppGpp synthetase/RelA/SpoT-type nucleotidyltranferase